MLFSKEELQNFLDEVKSSNTGSKDLEKIVKKEFKEWLSHLTDELKNTISNNSLLDPALKDERVKKAKNDFVYFKNTYFTHYLTIKGSCEFHEYLANLFKKITVSEDESKNAIAAPRGHAKTTYVSIMFVLWCVVFNKKHFIVEISDSVELVQGILESVKAELEENPNLKADFSHACGVSKLWRIGEIITNNGVKIAAFGTGTRIRGIRHGIYRPDLVILDDLENDTNVRSKLQRDRLEAWIDEAVANLGGLGNTLIILYIGTILHNDSVLARKIKSVFWNSAKFKSIINYPTNIHLWDEWQDILMSKGVLEADRFYKTNKILMDKGSKVLWKEALDIYKLMKKRAENKRSFDKEQQNEPSMDDALFKGYITFDDFPKCDAYYIGVDPALGKANGDYFAIALLGVKGGEFYLKADGYKIKPEFTINKIIDLYASIILKNKVCVIAIETVQFQEFYKDMLKKAAKDKGLILNIKEFKNTVPKELRLDAFSAPVSSGDIRIYSNSFLLKEELDTYPQTEHDDLLDASEMAFRIASKTHAANYKMVNKVVNNNLLNFKNLRNKL